MSTVQAVITTPDLDRQLAFHRRLFGAEQTQRFPADGPVFFVGLRIGDCEIGLVNEPGTDLTTSGRILLSVEVPDVDAALSQVEEAGGRVLGGPTDMPWGQRVAHIHDPDGNLLNLTTALPAGR